jgi:hypothetical protein
VILFEEKLHLDDTKDADHFEVKKFHLFCFANLRFLEYQFNKLAINEI